AWVFARIAAAAWLRSRYGLTPPPPSPVSRPCSDSSSLFTAPNVTRPGTVDEDTKLASPPLARAFSDTVEGAVNRIGGCNAFADAGGAGICIGIMGCLENKSFHRFSLDAAPDSFPGVTD